jgi:hypothetical protein
MIRRLVSARLHNLRRFGSDLGGVRAGLWDSLRGGWVQLRRMPWIPLLVSFFAVRALIPHWSAPLGSYDEGLLFTDAYLLNRGEALYRDFYANYPPGIFQIVRAILLLGLPAIWTARLLSLGVRVGSALCAGRLARRAQGQPGLCWWTVASVLALQEGLGLVLYAYPVAVLGALAVVLSWPCAGDSPKRAAVAPILFGLTSYVRHDLFVYGSIGLALIEGASWLLRRRSFFLDSLAGVRRFVITLAATMAVLWLPVLLRSGWYHPLHDLVLDQARRVMPGRMLPLPPLWDPFDIGSLGVVVPRVLGDRVVLCVAFAVVGAVAALVAMLSSRWSDSGDRELRARVLALLAVFTVATLPQALQRTDYFHTVYGIPLALAALSAAAGPAIRQPMLVLAALQWFAFTPGFARWDAVVANLSERSDERFVEPRRRELLQLIERETTPEDALYVGCSQHQRVVISPVDLLYLAKRKNATRYVQFDPGTVTSAEGQQEMIADLERTRPPLAVLDAYCFWGEPNASQNPGASLLDEYLAAHYTPERDVLGFAVLRRR